MNKQQLARVVADALGVAPTNPLATDAIDAVLDAITRAVTAGERVTVTGFGTFEAVDAPARLARNPQTGEQVHVPARRRVRFRVGPQFGAYADGRVPLPGDDQWAIRKAPRGSKTGGAR